MGLQKGLFMEPAGLVALKRQSAPSHGQADSKAGRHARNKTKRKAQLKLKAKSKPMNKTLQQAGSARHGLPGPKPAQGPHAAPLGPRCCLQGRKRQRHRRSTESHSLQGPLVA